MDRWEKNVGKLTGFLDSMAGIAMLGVMFLVVFNVLLRTTAGRPLLGTYEYVGFITTVIIGLALAHCAFLQSHIAVGFFMDRLPQRIGLAVDLAVHLAAVLFLGLASHHLIDYGRSMALAGEVSPTTKTPFFPFVYVIALGLVVLCLVLLVRIIKLTKVIKHG